MPRIRFIHPQAARTRIAPVGGSRFPAPMAAHEVAACRSHAAGYSSFPAADGGLDRFPAPTAG